MDKTTVLGLLAGLFTTLAFIPQVTKTWRSKSSRDISMGMFVLFTLGVFLWLIYGILIQSMPIIISNSVTFVFALSVVIMKLRYDP